MCAIELQVDEDNCRRGLVVTRGPAWNWGEQDGGDGRVGVILRQFYVDNPYRHTDKTLAEFENGEEAFAHTFDAPEKLCLVQVRWASACVQTYRIGTYGQQTMTLSDLCVAPDQQHPDALPLKKLYKFRTRADQDVEDLASVQLGNDIPAPYFLESMLLRFFRPKPDAIATMREVGDFLRDVLIDEADHDSAVCDFCDMLLCHSDDVCRPAPSLSRDDNGSCVSPVWATRLPCRHVFHRDCIRLCLMDHNRCPCRGCEETFQSFCGGDMEEDWGEHDDGDEDAEFVSGDTLQFISENRSVWTRMAAVIQHLETVDNMSIATRLLSPMLPRRDDSADTALVGLGCNGIGSCGDRRLSWGSTSTSLERESVLIAYGTPPVNVEEGKGRQRHAFMRKMRDVLTCVDLPQLEEAGWMIWEAFDMLVMGVRDRNQLVPQELDAQSAAVVDHLLDLVTRSPEEIDRELRHGRLTPSSSPSSTQAQGHAWGAILPPSAVSDEVDEVMKVLGLLASTASASLALESQEYHNEESQLDVSQMRIYIVPVLEYVLAADPLGVAFDLLQSRERDLAQILAKCGLKRGVDSAAVEKLWQEVVAADNMGREGREKELRGLAGETSEGRRRLGHVKLGMFKLALQSYERSSASVAARRLSGCYRRLKSGLRWLSNVAKTLDKKGRQVIRAGDAMYMIEIAPYVGGEALLWLLGFRWTACEGSPVGGGRLLAELPRHKLCYKVDKLFVGNACILLKEAIQSDRPRSPSSMAGGWVMGGVQQQPAITGGALQQQPAQPPDVLEAYQKNKSRAPAAQTSRNLSSRNLHRVCQWVASKIHSGLGPEVWAVFELEVLPRLEDIGVGCEGNFTAALAKVRDGARDATNIASMFRCDATTSDAIGRVLHHLQLLESDSQFSLSNPS